MMHRGGVTFKEWLKNANPFENLTPPVENLWQIFHPWDCGFLIALYQERHNLNTLIGDFSAVRRLFSP